MRSSRGTRNRSREPAIPVYVLHAGEDHPRACTGRRLIQSGIVRALSETAPWPGRLLLLDPHATIPLSRRDRDAAKSGLLAVDCSWNQLSDRGGYPRGAARLDHIRFRRRLPWLLAGNAQHYGRLGELNTAEALAGALYVLGSGSEAEQLLAAAGRGDSFLTLNRLALESYRSAKDAAEIESAERLFF